MRSLVSWGCDGSKESLFFVLDLENSLGGERERRGEERNGYQTVGEERLVSCALMVTF